MNSIKPFKVLEKLKKKIKMMLLQKSACLMTILLLVFMSACDTDSNNEDGARYYEFTHASDDIDYTLVAKTSDPEVIAQVEEELSKPFDERTKHINGKIERGNVEYNDDWSWHFVENRWTLAEISTEVCDGRPSFVEEELDYWVDQVGNYCPWSSRVAGEVNP